MGNNTECCGKERKTPYCPLCGKRLGVEGTLMSLLVHVRNTAAPIEKSVAHRERHLENALGNNLASDADRITRGLNRKRNLLSKWSGWEKALVAVIEAGDD